MNLVVKTTHEERMRLAEKIFQKLMLEKKDEILAVGLYGSMAKHTDQAFSDIEFDVIVKNETVDYSVSAICDGIKYEIYYLSKNALLDSIRNPGNIYWPETISACLTAKPFYDPENVFKEFKDEYARVIKTDFTPFYKKLFVDGIYESMCKFIKAAQNGDESKVRFYAYHYLFDEFICFIHILNKTVISNAATRWDDSLSMPVNFSSYKKFIHLLLDGDVKDAKAVVDAAMLVYTDIENFIKSSGIEVESKEIIL